jgi:hypothetical protein
VKVYAQSDKKKKKKEVPSDRIAVRFRARVVEMRAVLFNPVLVLRRA